MSCNKRITTPADIIAYINNPNNGLIKDVISDKFNASMFYKPWQLVSYNLRNKKSLDTAQEKRIKKKLFFVLRFSKNNKELLPQLPVDQYSEMVQIFAFRMAEYAQIVTGKGKIIYPEQCLFQQTYGLSTANQIILIFDSTKVGDPDEVDVKVREFGLGGGDLNFHFFTQDFKNLQMIL